MTIKRNIFSLSLAFAVCAWLLAACGAPKQSPCNVEIFTPVKKYSEAMLYDAHGKLIDSTLTVKNDSIRFMRNDVKNMPYIAKVKLFNPKDSLDIIYMPIVIEGGTVELELSDRISLGGTDDNEKLYNFQKTKNTFLKRYENEGHDVEKLKADYSKFFSDQILLNKDNVVGKYIYESYSEFLSYDDMLRVKEAMDQVN